MANQQSTINLNQNSAKPSTSNKNISTVIVRKGRKYKQCLLLADL